MNNNIIKSLENIRLAVKDSAKVNPYTVLKATIPIQYIYQDKCDKLYCSRLWVASSSSSSTSKSVNAAVCYETLKCVYTIHRFY